MNIRDILLNLNNFERKELKEDIVNDELFMIPVPLFCELNQPSSKVALIKIGRIYADFLPPNHGFYEFGGRIVEEVRLRAIDDPSKLPVLYQ